MVSMDKKYKYGSGEPVAAIRVWHKNMDQHAELINWLDAMESVPDGEHDLYTTPQLPQREGWQWVPVEPTDAMLQELDGMQFEIYDPSRKSLRVSAYKCLLAAAPKPTEGK